MQLLQSIATVTAGFGGTLGAWLMVRRSRSIPFAFCFVFLTQDMVPSEVSGLELPNTFTYEGIENGVSVEANLTIYRVFTLSLRLYVGK